MLTFAALSVNKHRTQCESGVCYTHWKTVDRSNDKPTVNNGWTEHTLDPHRAKSEPRAHHGWTRRQWTRDMRRIHSEYTTYHVLATFSLWNMRKLARWLDTASYYLVQSGRALSQTIDWRVTLPTRDQHGPGGSGRAGSGWPGLGRAGPRKTEVSHRQGRTWCVTGVAGPGRAAGIRHSFLYV